MSNVKASLNKPNDSDSKSKGKVDSQGLCRTMSKIFSPKP